MKFLSIINKKKVVFYLIKFNFELKNHNNIARDITKK